MALTVLFAFFVCHRAARALGWGKSRYKVVSTDDIAPGTREIILERESGPPIEPGTGQFIYINRKNRFGSSRPYTAAHWYPESGRIGVGVKAQGPGSTHISDAVPGETFLVDGPYGIFFKEVFQSTRPVVMIAGGIGITPFLRLAENLENTPDREGWLFYGNRLAEEAAYNDKLESLQNIDVITVISEDPGYQGEKGFITLGTLRKHLPSPLTQYEFLLCGPPSMIRKLETALLQEAAVPGSQIHHELFEL